MNSQQIQEIANRIYTEQQSVRQQYEKIGMELTAVMTATAEEIANHIEMVDEIAREYSVNLSYTKVPFGTSFDETIAMAEKKSKRNKRRAGYLTLVSKYGEASAKRIINKHNS